MLCRNLTLVFLHLFVTMSYNSAVVCCSLFSGTRKMAADPLRAATAYKDMAAAIHGAHDAANEARAAVKTVSRKVGVVFVIQ